MSTAFFTDHALPVFEHLSADSKRQLNTYLQEGNTAFRQKRLLELFQLVDWVPSDELSAHRALQKLPPPLMRQVQREILDYLSHKADNRAESAEKREQYKLRVFEYFRVKMPTADKALLESLRDYELDLTGRDVNWRHYFTLDSFKKIDAFIQASPAERQDWFTRFKKDVDTYKKNYDKLHNPPPGGWNEGAFTFDDWCDMMGDEAPRSQRHQQSQSSRQHASDPSGVHQAFQTLQLEWNASPERVKKQFRKLTLAHHPDLPNGSEETMKRIIAAYEDIKRFWKTGAQAM